MTLENAEKLALKCLKNVMEDPISVDNVELAVIPTATCRYTVRGKEYIGEIIRLL